MASKILHFIKMSWMLIWRVLLFTTFFAFAQNWQTNLVWASLIGSAIVVFGFGKSLRTFPIIRAFFMRDTLILDFDKPKLASRNPNGRSYGNTRPRGNARPTTSTPSYAPHQGSVPYSHGPKLNGATANGRMTGFEPKAMEHYPVPKIHSMTGVPGAGLQNAAGMTKTNIALGTAGEQNFAKALAKTGAIKRFRTVWSVPVPSMDRLEPNKYGTDIDCVIETASAVFLVDLKNYKSGDVQYYSHNEFLNCVDRATNQPVGDTKVMSRNMEMATNAVRKHFPRANVVPVVVFMPTDKGEGELLDVVWPGDVPAMNLTEFLTVLNTQGDSVSRSESSYAAARLGGLVTKYVNTY